MDITLNSNSLSLVLLCWFNLFKWLKNLLVMGLFLLVMLFTPFLTCFLFSFLNNWELCLHWDCTSFLFELRIIAIKSLKDVLLLVIILKLWDSYLSDTVVTWFIYCYYFVSGSHLLRCLFFLLFKFVLLNYCLSRLFSPFAIHYVCSIILSKWQLPHHDIWLHLIIIYVA